MTQPLDREMLLKLAASVEELQGPDREADCLIWCHVNDILPEWQGNCLVAGIEGVIGWIDPGEHQRNFSCNRADQGVGGIKAYTSSLDAAMTLIDADTFFHISRFNDEGGGEAHVYPNRYVGDDYKADAATPALALTAAALRARAQTPSLDRGD